MKQLVILPGGFHPYHAGHYALYQSATKAFPNAEVYVAATADTSNRPFPFELKQKLAQLAGVPADHFVQVKSPFQAREITSKFDPEDTQLIFVRSDKDKNTQPQPGGTKRDGSPSYLQPYSEKQTEPMNKHGYMAYLPTVEFGPGMKSASEIRAAWPQLDEKRKTALVMSLYPVTQKNKKLAGTVVKMLDAVLGETVEENQGWAATLEGNITPKGGLGSWSEDALRFRLVEKLQAIVDMMRRGDYSGVEYAWNDSATRAMIQALADIDRPREDIQTAGTAAVGGMKASYQARENQPPGDYIEEKWSEKYKSSINCKNPRGFSQKAHCAGRKK